MYVDITWGEVLAHGTFDSKGITVHPFIADRRSGLHDRQERQGVAIKDRHCDPTSRLLSAGRLSLQQIFHAKTHASAVDMSRMPNCPATQSSTVQYCTLLDYSTVPCWHRRGRQSLLLPLYVLSMHMIMYCLPLTLCTVHTYMPGTLAPTPRHSSPSRLLVPILNHSRIGCLRDRPRGCHSKNILACSIHPAGTISDMYVLHES